MKQCQDLCKNQVAHLFFKVTRASQRFNDEAYINKLWKGLKYNLLR